MNRIVPIFFGLTLFLSAFLVFYCEPMIGKMVLPFLGGAPSVWTTCVLFFQTILLAGYGYAYAIDRFARLRTQLILHIVLMSVAVIFLPIHFTTTTTTAVEHPISWLLTRLFLAAAVPFGVVVSAAPLLQNWLSKTSTASARDPYFLYAASNAGSLLALLSYPLLVEPRLGLMAQSRAWLDGYVLLLLAVVAAALIVWKRSPGPAHSIKGEVDDEAIADRPRRAYWLAASFIPSALMLAVTNHISANLVAAPLLWVIPLAVYLITFILAFARSDRLSPARISAFVPIIFLLSPYVTIGAPVPAALIWIVFPAHIAILFSGAWLCHAALAASRPATRRLTEFYFWIALGGALGGVFAVIIAPNVFSTVFEYPLLVATLGFFRMQPGKKEERNRRDFIYPALVGLILVIEWLVFRYSASNDAKEAAVGLLTNGGFVIIYSFRARMLRFALALAVFGLGSAVILPGYFESGQRLYLTRNFFGVKKVLLDDSQHLRKMLHGDTVHGVESTEPGKEGVPLSYYHFTGPAGDVFEATKGRADQNIGIIGLGTGSLAAYASPGRRITFFDPDPQMIQIAERFFTYLRHCGNNCRTVLADGRLGVAQEPDGAFDLLVVDAFSSDSIPAHLVSREAIQVYLSRLKPEGLLLFHVSNRYLDVGALVSAVLTSSGLAAYERQDGDETIPGKSGSRYVVAARRALDLGSLASDRRWKTVDAPQDLRPWTDDYSNIADLIRW